MCFTLHWFQQLLVWAVIIIAIIAILKILVPYALNKIGAEIGEGMGVLIACGRIALWAVIVIFVIYIVFALIYCLLSYGGGLPLFPHR